MNFGSLRRLDLESEPPTCAKIIDGKLVNEDFNEIPVDGQNAVPVVFKFPYLGMLRCVLHPV